MSSKPAKFGLTPAQALAQCKAKRTLRLWDKLEAAQRKWITDLFAAYVKEPEAYNVESLLPLIAEMLGRESFSRSLWRKLLQDFKNAQSKS